MPRRHSRDRLPEMTVLPTNPPPRWRFRSNRQTGLALLLAVLAVASWWVLRGREPLAPDPRPRSGEPDYVAIEFAALETAPDGQPLRRLSAPQLRQFVDEGRIELDRPRFEFIQPDQAPWHARADRGILFEGDDELRLSGQVELSQIDADARTTRLTTEQLSIWHQRAYARSLHPVQLTRDQDWLTANGMEVWYAAPMRARFGSQARIGLHSTQDRHQ